MAILATDLAESYADRPLNYLYYYCASLLGAGPSPLLWRFSSGTFCVEHVIADGGLGIFRIRDGADALADGNVVRPGFVIPGFAPMPPRHVAPGEDPRTGVISPVSPLLEQTEVVAVHLGAIY